MSYIYNNRKLDIYTDFLIYSSSYTTATELSRIFNKDITHDQITYLLNKKEYTSESLFKSIKPFIRKVENEEGVLIIDDTISEKPYTDTNEIVQYYHSGIHNRVIKGINIITGLVSYKDKENNDESVNLPFDYEIIKKDKEYVDKEGNTKYRSSISKNDIFRSIIGNSIKYQLKYKYVLADSWYCNVDNINYLNINCKKQFILGIPSNRNVYLSEKDIHDSNSNKINSIFEEDTNEKIIYIKNIHFALKLIKYKLQRNNEVKIIYLITNDLSLNYEEVYKIYTQRWKIEEYHKSIKQNTCLSKSPTKRVISQSNHIFGSILAFCKLERLKIKSRLNHFALKAKLFTIANQILQKQLCELMKRYRLNTIDINL